MDLDDDLKYSMDCEVNRRLRRTDAIRCQLFQLQAMRTTMPSDILLQRQSELLEEYSFLVDKPDENNSFINAALYFAKDSPRVGDSSRWTCSLASRLKSGELPRDVLRSFNAGLADKQGELSDRFKQFHKKKSASFFVDLVKPSNDCGKLVKFIDHRISICFVSF